MVLGPVQVIRSDDYHTAGEPFRIVDAGPMEGETVLDRRSWAIEHLDDLRRFLVAEPRGHAGMYGGFVVPAWARNRAVQEPVSSETRITLRALPPGVSIQSRVSVRTSEPKPSISMRPPPAGLAFGPAQPAL